VALFMVVNKISSFSFLGTFSLRGHIGIQHIIEFLWLFMTFTEHLRV
jgi:hypothetical protein